MRSNNEIPAVGCSAKRLKSDMRVYYGPSQQTPLSGFSVDLSAGGLYLKQIFP